MNAFDKKHPCESLGNFTCAVAGTLVHTNNGLVPIERLKIGDLVLSQSEENGDAEFKRVIRTSSYDDRELFLMEYFLPDEMNAHHLVVTGNHRFWVEEEGWTVVDYLDPGQTLQIADGGPAIVYKVRKILNTETRNVGWTSDDPSSPGPLIDLRDDKISVSKTLSTEEIYNPEAFDVEDNYFRSKVFNIEVEDFHTYFIGEAGIWAHD